MKRTLQTLIMLGAIAVFWVSCTDEVQEQEYVEVSFTATLPAEVETRSADEKVNVNTLTVGVFDEGGGEIERYEFPFSPSSDADIQLALAKGKTYSLVFWAYNDECDIYDTEDMTAIRMDADKGIASFADAERSESFYATLTDITTDKTAHVVKLVRPLARINVGTGGKAEAATFVIENVSDTFHPFSGDVSGDATFTWSFTETTDKTFTVEDKEYTCLATGYLFAPVESEDAVSCKLKAGDAEFVFPEVSLRANYKSNIVGTFTKILQGETNQ